MMMMAVMMMVVVAVPQVLTKAPAMLRPARHPLGSTVGHVVEQHLAGCHLVAATWHRHSLGLDNVLSSLDSFQVARIVLDASILASPHAAANTTTSVTAASSAATGERAASPQLWRRVMDGQGRNCRAVILDVTDYSSSSSSSWLPSSPPPPPLLSSSSSPPPSSFSSSSSSFNTSSLSANVAYSSTSVSKIDQLMSFLHLYLWPATRVVALGSHQAAEPVLASHALRNTAHALFLAPSTTKCGREGRCVMLLSRCMYCYPGGVPGVRVSPMWQAEQALPSHLQLFPGGFEDMSGHSVRVVAKTLFPFMEFERHDPAPGAPVTPMDSLDVRMLDTVAEILNFTYVVRPPKDEQWGTKVDGVWTGMVGTLEAEEADVSMMLFWSFARKQVIDFTRIYTNEPFVMITRKPRPLPQHLALVRPFSDIVWTAVLFSTMLAGGALWALQKTWASFSGGHAPSLSTSLLHTWGMLLEDPPVRTPSNTTGQMLVGWWWLFCLLLTASYRSSLIAHLSVPTTPPPIDTLKQLLSVPGATWGIEPGFGLGWDWFKLNQNPEVQAMFRTLQVMDMADQMPQVLKGRHAFFTWKYYIKTIVASRYTNLQGVTPIHMGLEEFVPGSTGWGVRKGLPFLPPMDRIHDRLVEAGLVNHWLDELFETAMKKARKEAAAAQEEAERKGEKVDTSLLSDDESGKREQLVLTLNHLQGAFYLLLLGVGVASLLLVGENVLARSFPSQSAASRDLPVHKHLSKPTNILKL
ncbi:hypothetical protein O3P69_001863 [Scylla paramamosain]|uniref:Ionotropic glutamate receptor L-glutamate and glycine-binding domain-containing protein n=1 Tax=Scylla paramamosain TaxID=85552 RepID=A0AAW0V4X2_SCYPA